MDTFGNTHFGGFLRKSNITRIESCHAERKVIQLGLYKVSGKELVGINGNAWKYIQVHAKSPFDLQNRLRLQRSQHVHPRRVHNHPHMVHDAAVVVVRKKEASA